MQTVFPGERKLKRRLMWQMWKEMFINLIKKKLGRTAPNKNPKGLLTMKNHSQPIPEHHGGDHGNTYLK